ncbi:MAG: hypothetical protein LC657_06835, partial [Desulfobacteraceae bacterium]|nr:hypothetical protein [Desulfobacteraceae bacterium]
PNTDVQCQFCAYDTVSKLVQIDSSCPNTGSGYTKYIIVPIVFPTGKNHIENYVHKIAYNT